MSLSQSPTPEIDIPLALLTQFNELCIQYGVAVSDDVSTNLVHLKDAVYRKHGPKDDGGDDTYEIPKTVLSLVHELEGHLNPIIKSDIIVGSQVELAEKLQNLVTRYILGILGDMSSWARFEVDADMDGNNNHVIYYYLSSLVQSKLGTDGLDQLIKTIARTRGQLAGNYNIVLLSEDKSVNLPDGVNYSTFLQISTKLPSLTLAMDELKSNRDQARKNIDRASLPLNQDSGPEDMGQTAITISAQKQKEWLYGFYDDWAIGYSPVDFTA